MCEPTAQCAEKWSGLFYRLQFLDGSIVLDHAMRFGGLFAYPQSPATSDYLSADYAALQFEYTALLVVRLYEDRLPVMTSLDDMQWYIGEK